MFDPEMISKAREMMEKMKEDLQKMAITASAGGGAVTVVVNGGKELTKIEFSKDAPKDREQLADLVLAAVSGAYAEVDREHKDRMPNLDGFDFSKIKDMFGA